ncbi:DUF6294 family protein [Nocardia sp. CA-129566]|uniref:DUF6294 family protein n=1 Tax=Nocardia sp. CA-129566 TaxID=3239976 RepID=UPI003D98A934
MTNSQRVIRAVFAVVIAAAVPMGFAGSAQAEESFTWEWKHDRHAGDCTMFAGAKWTLNDKGKAEFEAVVTSGSNFDAWLMWVQLRDEQGNVLGWMRNADRFLPDPGDRRKFVMGLDDKSQRYVWTAHGEFDSVLWPKVSQLHLDDRC